MVRERLAASRARIREWVERAFAEDHTPREIAASFALGTFVAVLPTGGTALVLFVVAAYLFDRVSKLGLLAALVVFNPPVKWSIYGASFWLGRWLLGPVSGVSGSTPTELSLAAGTGLLARHLLGNVVLAVIFAALGYAIVLRLVREYRRKAGSTPELAA